MAMSSSLEADRLLIAQIASLISELAASIRTLRDEQKAAQNRLDSYKYPVLTLPNELVSEIFINFLPTLLPLRNLRESLPPRISPKFADPGTPEEYLRIFVAPALRALRIPEQCLGAEPIQVLQAFISQSECKLTELCVTNEITVIQDLNTYREVFPSISRLVLDGWIVDDDLDKDDIYEVDDLELLTE
ncbi:hypothetical protein C8R46DRAFT_1342439 [Mycena filopes]|nr:hypothetical protein C8R46DRAFT_1342439 [Mycena filopes]